MVTARSPPGAENAMITVTVAVLPSGLTVGGLLTSMPVEGRSRTSVAPCMFRPLIVRTKVFPAASKPGTMDCMTGFGPTSSRFTPGATGGIVPDRDETMTVLAPTATEDWS